MRPIRSGGAPNAVSDKESDWKHIRQRRSGYRLEASAFWVVHDAIRARSVGSYLTFKRRFCLASLRILLASTMGEQTPAIALSVCCEKRRET